MSPLPILRVCSCICSNRTDGDMAARVAAVRWMADCTTVGPDDDLLHQGLMEERVIRPCGSRSRVVLDYLPVRSHEESSGAAGRVNHTQLGQVFPAAPVNVLPSVRRQSQSRKESGGGDARIECGQQLPL